MSSKSVYNFFRWKSQINELYDGIIINTLSSRQISLNFKKESTFLSDSILFNLITSDNNTSSSYINNITAVFPKKGNQEINPEWGSIKYENNIKIEGKINCCNIDEDDNIYLGTDQSCIYIDTSVSDYKKVSVETPYPIYIQRPIPGKRGNSIVGYSKFGYHTDNNGNPSAFHQYALGKFDIGSPDILEMCKFDRPLLDLSVNSNCESILAVTGQKKLFIVDVRDQNPTFIKQNSMCSVEYSNSHGFLFLCGSTSGQISLFDLRSPTIPIVSSSHHSSSITSIRWSNFNRDVFATASLDCSIQIWALRSERANDITKVFAHYGHCSPITAFDWCRDRNWTISSVSDDNLFEVWSIAKSKVEGIF